MNLSGDRGNPFLIAYSLARRSGFLSTALGRRLFKSAYFLYKRYIEDDLRDLLRSFPAIVGAGNILDVGANIGYTAVVLARAAESGRKVYAFEPEPFNFKLLLETAHQPEFAGKIVPMQLAVGAQDGNINLWINEHHHADHRVATEQFRSANPDSKEVRVPLVSASLISIDSFLQRQPGPVSFVKIDVQGYELAVCQGMQETLRRNPDLTIVLEFMPSALRDLGFEPSLLIDFLVERDFKVYQIHPHGKLSPGMPEIKNNSGYCDLLFSRSPIPSGPEK